MALKFTNPREAFLSVLSLVIGADQVGSLEERNFLFEKVKNLPLFGNPSLAEFSKLLGQVTDTLYSQLPTDDGELTSAAIGSALTAAKQALNAEQQKTLLAVAAELTTSDGETNEESSLLNQMRRVFA